MEGDSQDVLSLWRVTSLDWSTRNFFKMMESDRTIDASNHNEMKEDLNKYQKLWIELVVNTYNSKTNKATIINPQRIKNCARKAFTIFYVAHL